MGIALFLMMNVMYLSYVLYVGYFDDLAPEMQRLVPLLLLVLAIPSVFWCALPLHRKAWHSMLSGAPTMEVLFSLSIFAAFFYSLYALLIGHTHVYFDTAASLVALFLVGKFVEVSARHRATKDVSRLYRALPKKARVVTDDGEKLTSVEQLAPGDRFLVRSGEKIPADGVVTKGNALVDESLLTGESRPVSKAEGDSVTGSTLSLDGALEITAQRVGNDTVLASIIHLVEGALTRRSSLERSVDRIARVFIPAVLLLAAGAGTALLLFGQGFEAALLRTITVLVVACPCALGLATPLAVAAAVGFAARRGVLVRDGDALQVARKVDTVVFDKTGTLTQGRFVFHGSSFENEEEALTLLGTLERTSNHPVAEALVAECHARQIKLGESSEVVSVQGMGVTGTVDPGGDPESTTQVIIGNRRFLAEKGFSTQDLSEDAQRAEELGQTIVFAVLVSSSEVGFVALGDSLKAQAAEVVRELSGKRLEVRLLSGDSVLTTAAIAEQAGIAAYTAEVVPGEKIKIIRQLQADQAIVAMIGDGINDAPALAQADVGLAMGSGTDIAQESAAVVVLRDDLSAVSGILDLSQRTHRVILQNLSWAFLYNGIGLVLAATGYLNPLIAAVAMLASSISVILNSIRLSQEKGEAGKAVLEILMPWRA
jgi:heavy metal translocating P-type ATPase